MLDQLKKHRQNSAYALFKKILIILSLILLILNGNVSHFNKAKASGTGVSEAPGYADEMIKGIFTTISIASGAVVHAGNTVEDNLKQVVDVAMTTWNKASPHMKQSFIDSMNAAGDRIVIAGNLIEGFLYNLNPFNSIPEAVKGSEGLEIVYSSPTSRGFSFKSVEGKEIILNGYVSGFSFTMTAFDNGGTISANLGKALLFKPSFNEEDFAKYSNIINSISTPMQLVDAYNSLAVAANSNWRASLSYGDTAIGTVPQDPIYDQMDRWFRDRFESGALTLGLPQSVPFTSEGLKLGVSDALGGLTLDGTNLYTGDIVWRDVLAGVAEGTLSLPAPFIYNPLGIPVTLVDGIPVAADGSIVNPSDLTVVANPPTTIANEYGDVTTVINTWTGSTVNTITNEWVTYNTYVYEATTGTVTPKPETPPKKPDKKPTSNDGSPNSLFLALLLSMLDLIRSIIWYLIRLFNFVVQLPKTPSMEIPNPVFQWFISAKFVGINVYQSAVYLTTFALSFGVFKVIRRYFND